MKVLKALGSLRFAITLILGLAAILAVSTVMESVHGTPFAQKHFYTSRWFDLFLSLFWINIFCSTLTRWPFEKKHIGFVITHVGILTLLVGALLSRALGSEGQMALFEGEESDRIRAEESTDKPSGRLLIEGSLSAGQAGEDALLNHAVTATLFGETMGVNETFTLIERDPNNPHAFFTEIGPAYFELVTETGKPSTPKLRIERESTKENWTLQLDKVSPSDETPLGRSGFVVSNLKYYAHAKVSGSRIVETTQEEVPFNPAVEFTVHDSTWRTENHTRFYLFPDFDSLRGGRAANIFDLKVSITDAALPEELRSRPVPAFTFHAAPDGRWTYRVTSKKKAPVEGVLEIGKKIPTGWMDMTVEVKQTFNRARINKPSKSSKKPAAYLPFKLRLLDFRKVDYPGTASPASFESDVVLMDTAEKLAIQKTIKMNKPLDYRGWRIFQSSYMMDDRYGEGSVFTIAKNPGIALIYGSAPIILLGVILLFYFHPFFNDKVH